MGKEEKRREEKLNGKVKVISEQDKNEKNIENTQRTREQVKKEH